MINLNYSLIEIIWHIFLMLFGLFYFCGIIVGLLLMSEHLSYPKIKIIEFEKGVCLPFYSYYLIFKYKMY